MKISILLLSLVILNILFAVLNYQTGVEEQRMFSMWVSGFNAATAFAIFLAWLLIINARF